MYTTTFSFFFFFVFLSIVHSFPCPPECLCQPVDVDDVDFTRMAYIIDCTNRSLKDDKLIYRAEPWSIMEDRTIPNENEDSDDPTNDYLISLRLSINQFNNQTIQLSGFSFFLQSLSLDFQPTRQLNSNSFFDSNTFNGILFQQLKLLNLSNCHLRSTAQCSQLFRPLENLQVLDLSNSDMYKVCLNTPGTISTNLQDLILRNNEYEGTTFSHTSRLFDGVSTITGKLDLQSSLFRLNAQVTGNCLFDLFIKISALDMSGVRFLSTSSNDTEIHLAHFLKCKGNTPELWNGRQLTALYLRQIGLTRLPEWFVVERFPQLRELDLSDNRVRSIDLNTFVSLRRISLANNPIETDQIALRDGVIYELIDLRSTINRTNTFDLSRRLKTLFKSTTNIDYSENRGLTPTHINISRLPIGVDFPDGDFRLHIRATNVYTFNFIDNPHLDELRQLDISQNRLIELDLQRQTKLTHLQCSNQLNQSLERLILHRDMHELSELICSNNRLKNVENFPPSTHDRLTTIDLSNNRFESMENLFQNVNGRRLRTIRLGRNRFSKISTNTFSRRLISLFEIDLSWNQIESIDTNAIRASNLQILDLTGNPLRKFAESNAIFTGSLRLFYIVNRTQSVCVLSLSNEKFLRFYTNWFDQNGSYMIDTRSDRIPTNKCIHYYTSRSKSKWTTSTIYRRLPHLALYIAIASGLILGTIYLYKKNKFTFLARLQRYKPIDRNNLVENVAEMDGHLREDDEIVMNLDDPPFTTMNNRSLPTRV